VQGIAEPNTVVISSTTYRLIQGFFECHNLGLHTVKGVSTPVSLYRVLAGSTAQSRLDVAATTGLTPFVGREPEVGLLLERWEQVKEGLGQIVLLSGEAGIGKSRILQVQEERLTGDSYTHLECRCSPYYQNSSLYSVIDLLQRVFEFRKEDSAKEKLSKLEEALGQYSFSLLEIVPLFASLLSLPLNNRYPPITLTPQRQKQKTLAALVALFLKLAERRPLLFTVEDLQWGDPSTLEFLSLLIDQGPTARIFILLAFRPEFIPPWITRPHLTRIALTRLPRRQVEAMVTKVAGDKALPYEVLQQLVAKTDGVPLFVEELTKAVLESGLLTEGDGQYELTGPLPQLAIPATLQDSLRARLDRLPVAKEVVQLGAIIGREFTYEVLQAVSPLEERTLQLELARLVEAELLYQRGLPPQATYLFKNALIQEAAYQSLLKSKRQRYHEQIAQVLAEKFIETAETQPELLAYHYTEAGLTEQALVYWQRAGQRATQRSANVEAISHLTTALELLKTFPDSPQRTQQELALQTTLGPALMATRGYGAPEVEKAYARARELCQQLGETPQLFPVLFGLWVFYNTRAELQPAQELAEQLLTLAQSVQDPALLLEAHLALGTTLFSLGELASAQVHLEQGIALYDPQQHRSLAFRSGQDPGVFCRAFAPWALWYLGYPAQALQRSQEALTLAQELSHPLSLALALDLAAVLHQLRREGQAAQERAEAMMVLCGEHGFPLFLAQGTILRGWALAEQGQREEGIAQMCQGMAAFRATGAELLRPYSLALLAEAYGEGGQAEEGLAVLAEALAAAHKSGERDYEAELCRLKGELLLVQEGKRQKRFPRCGVPTGTKGESEEVSEAEECFRQALDTARRQSAKSLELRAVMSLSRLWQKQGKTAEARQMLTEIYDWFTEGFDTADLQEAKALLNELI
jgi:predicted ATPase